MKIYIRMVISRHFCYFKMIFVVIAFKSPQFIKIEFHEQSASSRLKNISIIFSKSGTCPQITLTFSCRENCRDSEKYMVPMGASPTF